MLFVSRETMDRKTTGNIGEYRAARYLESKGYSILRTNYKQKWGEVDIIAKTKDNILVFVEVKTLRQYGNSANQSLSPEEQISVAKYRKMQKMAQSCAGAKEFQKYINEEKGWRIDAVAVELSKEGSIAAIRHYENI